jgi:hypothetical protein
MNPVRGTKGFTEVPFQNLAISARSNGSALILSILPSISGELTTMPLGRINVILVGGQYVCYRQQLFRGRQAYQERCCVKVLVRSRKRHPRCLPGVRSSKQVSACERKIFDCGEGALHQLRNPRGLPILNSDSKEYTGRLRRDRMKLSCGEVPADRKALVKSAEEES